MTAPGYVAAFFCLCLSLAVSSIGYAERPKEPDRIYGRIKVVNSFANYRVRIVYENPDIHITRVKEFPNSHGRWQIVKNLEDYTVQYVDKDEDFTVEFVDQEGMDQKAKWLRDQSGESSESTTGEFSSTGSSSETTEVANPDPVSPSPVPDCPENERPGKEDKWQRFPRKHSDNGTDSSPAKPPAPSASNGTPRVPTMQSDAHPNSRKPLISNGKENRQPPQSTGTPSPRTTSAPSSRSDRGGSSASSSPTRDATQRHERSGPAPSSPTSTSTSSPNAQQNPPPSDRPVCPAPPAADHSGSSGEERKVRSL